MPILGPDASRAAKIERIRSEMRKFKKGLLRSSSGSRVTSRKQAIAIALSEAGMSKDRKAGRKRARRSARK